MSCNNKAKLLRKKKQNMYFTFITIDDSLMNLKTHFSLIQNFISPFWANIKPFSVIHHRVEFCIYWLVIMIILKHKTFIYIRLQCKNWFYIFKTQNVYSIDQADEMCKRKRKPLSCSCLRVTYALKQVMLPDLLQRENGRHPVFPHK